MNKRPGIPADSPIQHILVVDDEKSLLLLLTKALTRVGYTCQAAISAEKAWDLLTAEDMPGIDLIITDIAMPGMDGIELLKKIKHRFPAIDVIVMTGHASNYSYVEIMDAGASDYMSKPFDLNSALARINRIAREKRNLIQIKQTNQQLCQAIERANELAMEADQASRAKTFFLASMSHEIRTPLNGIVGYTDMLMDTPLNEEQASFLKAARLSCDTLLSVVNDILDFSKVEAGELRLEDIEFDPEILCFDAIDLVRTQVDESRVELLCRISDDVPGQVVGDPHRFRQVLLNLLGNAVKFTEKGAITVSVEARNRDENQTLLTVSVTDTGIGIAEKEQERIFEPFIQSESDITHRGAGGTGLGLAISRNIAMKMGGNVRVSSSPGRGSTFHFTSRLAIGAVRKTKRIRPVGLAGKRVLLSTTSGETLDILEREMRPAGLDIHHVPLETLARFLDTTPDPDFHIGILDFGKSVKHRTTQLPPEMTRLQPDKWPFGCIACSVPFPGIAALFESAGFKGFLPKPIRKSNLFEMMAYVMGMTDQPATEEIVTVHSLAEQKKYGVSILLVEDNPVNQKMTQLMLSKAGYSVTVAANGLEALDQYHSGKFDLIFMDINMPKMDGFEATRCIRSHEAEDASRGRIPILALTANVLDDFRLKCAEAGMDDFLTKPIKRDLVFQSIQKWARPAPRPTPRPNT